MNGRCRFHKFTLCYCLLILVHFWCFFCKSPSFTSCLRGKFKRFIDNLRALDKASFIHSCNVKTKNGWCRKKLDFLSGFFLATVYLWCSWIFDFWGFVWAGIKIALCLKKISQKWTTFVFENLKLHQTFTEYVSDCQM